MRARGAVLSAPGRAVHSEVEKPVAAITHVASAAVPARVPLSIFVSPMSGTLG
jgi:hypothetical protein